MSESPKPKPAKPGLKFLLRALSHRNYRLFFGGQGVSLIGTWMTKIATSWLVFRMSDAKTAALWLGLVNFLGQIPTFFLSPIAGVWIDRWNRHRVLVVTQVLSMLESFLLAAAAGIPQPPEWVIAELLALNAFQGLVNAIEIPCRQSFVVEMVASREDLPNAIALNSSMVNGARLVGPSIAGLLIAAVGEVGCFLIDGISYLGVIVALLLMNVPPRAQTHARAHWREEMKEGFRYAWSFLPVRALLWQLGSVSFLGVTTIVLMPIFANRIQSNSPSILGFLMGAVGAGSLIGAFYLASRKTVVGLGQLIVLCTFLLGFGQLGFAFSRSLWFSIPLLGLCGFGMMVQMAASNTILQTIVDDRMRGRLMSLYTASVMGMLPFGSLFAGGVSHLIGAPAAVAISGAGCLLTALWFRRRLRAIAPLMRPIYESKGLLKDTVFSS